MSSSHSESESSYQTDDSDVNYIPGYTTIQVDDPGQVDHQDSSSDSDVDEPYADEPLADEEWLKQYNKQMKEIKDVELKQQKRFESTEEIIEWRVQLYNYENNFSQWFIIIAALYFKTFIFHIKGVSVEIVQESPYKMQTSAIAVVKYKNVANPSQVNWFAKISLLRHLWVALPSIQGLTPSAFRSGVCAWPLINTRQKRNQSIDRQDQKKGRLFRGISYMCDYHLTH